MKLYELTYLISPELLEEELNSVQNKVNVLIQENSGILIEAPRTVKKNLGYPVRKKNAAFLSRVNFNLSPEKISNLEEKLKQEGKIIRYLILSSAPTKTGEIYRKPKIATEKPKPKKVEIEEIEKKLEEILGE